MGDGKSGGGSSYPTSSSQTSTFELPAWAQPYMQSTMQGAYEEANKPYPIYPGTQIAGLTPEHEQALAGIKSAVSGSGPLLQGAQQNWMDTIAGKYLYPESNPYLAATYGKAAGDVTNSYLTGIVPQLSAGASQAHAFGGSADQLLQGQAMRQYGDTLQNLATNLYGQNYQTERGRQYGAVPQAGQVWSQLLAPQQALMGVGDVYRQQEQAQLEEQYQKWAQQNLWGLQQKQYLASLFASLLGGQGTSTSAGTGTSFSPNPYQSSPLSSIFGGISSSLGMIPVLASMFV